MGFSAKKKLLVVDDSAFMRKLISDFFKDHPLIEVVGTARNGKDAIQKIQKLSPNVVTMDVEMPEMNGLEALQTIMSTCPVPVIMLSSTTLHGKENTLTAMEYGAVDFVAKPSGAISLDLHKIQEELVKKAEQAVTVPVAKLKKSASETQKTKPTKVPVNVGSFTSPSISIPKKQDIQLQTRKTEWNRLSKKIVLIGTSTGGPRALQEVITKIPADIQAPILIVQHMPAGFTKSLATRLNQLSEISVKEAEQGDILKNGVAYIAPGGYHMRVKKTGISYAIMLDQQEPPRSGHRPSVDVMFEDISQYNEFDKIAVIMTGMGQDGSQGLIALKQNGNVMAIAESADTCIVYGMPKAAVETQLVDEVADVDDIAQSIMKYML